MVLERNLVAKSITALLAVMLWLAPATAEAEGVGAHAGISIDPEQFHFGAQAETGPLADRIRFRPSISLGVGDDVTITSLNVEFAYHFRSAEPWNLYAGGGPALNVIRRPGDTDPEPGLNAFVGVAHEDGLFADIKIGAFDSPRVRVAVGYHFRWR